MAPWRSICKKHRRQGQNIQDDSWNPRTRCQRCPPAEKAWLCGHQNHTLNLIKDDPLYVFIQFASTRCWRWPRNETELDQCSQFLSGWILHRFWKWCAWCLMKLLSATNIESFFLKNIFLLLCFFNHKDFWFSNQLISISDFVSRQVMYRSGHWRDAHLYLYLWMEIRDINTISLV